MSQYRFAWKSVAVASFVVFACMAPPIQAAETESTIDVVKPFLDENTVAVVGLKTRALDSESLQPSLMKVLPAGEHFVGRVTARVESLNAVLSAAGVEEIFLVFSLTDGFQEMPFVVVPGSADLDTAAMTGLLQEWQDRAFPSRKLHEAMVFGDESTLNRLADLNSTPPPRFSAARAVAGEAAVWAVLMASEDHRRVIEAMQPKLPTVAGGGDVRMLTRGIEWAAMTVETTPGSAVKLVVQASDADAAADLQELTKKLLVKLQNYRPLEERWPEFVEHADDLVPTVTGDQLQLTFDPSNDTLRALVDIISQPVRQVLTDQARKQAMNDLKQLGLGMHNYYSKHNHLPTAATTDAEGRPLLSWRVQLLPYIEQQELYDAFHLDEPWDSEHNRSLIPRMPEIFRVPLSRHEASDGRANYVVPGGERTMFPPKGKVTFREITDGTSDTIMVAEVDDEHAEIWTKPGGYEIDPNQPARGLGGHFAEVFLTGFGDGSARAVPLSMAKEMHYGLFTRDGGEAVQW